MAEVCRGIYAGEPKALTELYALARRAARKRLSEGAKDLFPEWCDVAGEVYVRCVEQLQRVPMNNPDGLAGFVWTVTDRTICGLVRNRIQMRRRVAPTIELNGPRHYVNGSRAMVRESVLAKETADQPLEEKEKMASVYAALARLNSMDRSILILFYFEEWPKERIQAHLHIDEDQFRNLKSRAKAKLALAVKQGKGFRTRQHTPRKRVAA
jgi:RNA polymerase sigma-70 factor (ECF subfamily)